MAVLHVCASILSSHQRRLQHHRRLPTLLHHPRQRHRRPDKRLHDQAVSVGLSPSAAAKSKLTLPSTGLYRLAITIANTLTIASFSIIFLRWRGQIGWPETVILCFPVGIGFGVSLSAAFIGLAAGLDPSQVAVSTSGFYLSLNIGSLTGVTSASVLISVFVQRELSRRLGDLPNAGQIIRDVMSSFDSINDLPREVGQVVLGAYTQSFKGVWCKFLSSEWEWEALAYIVTVTCLIFGCLSLVAGMVMREGQLEESTPPRPPTTVRTQNYNTFASPNKPVDE